MRMLPIQLGLAIVTGTHLWMLNELMPPAMQRHHAMLNLGAAAAVAYGVWS